MEVYFDTLSSAVKSNPQILKEDVNMQKMLCELTSYYESGQWLQDFEADERGELPKDLKRGVREASKRGTSTKNVRKMVSQ